MWGGRGGGRKMATQAMPPSPKLVKLSPKSAGLPRVAPELPARTREVSAKELSD
jgi:hypothetical protein